MAKINKPDYISRTGKLSSFLKLIAAKPSIWAICFLLIVSGLALGLKPYLKYLDSKASGERSEVTMVRSYVDSTGQIFSITEQVLPAQDYIDNFDPHVGTVVDKINTSNKIDATAHIPDADGVIVEFDDLPVWSKFSDELKTGKPSLSLRSDMQVYRDELNSKQNVSKAGIERILKTRLANKTDKKAGQTRSQFYTDAVNAIAIYDVPVDQTMSSLQSLPGIKQVSPNLIVKTQLLDSPEIIGAPTTWEKFDDQGRSNIGMGMKIGIVDTGVDYTHPDLGGCFGPGCKVEGGRDFVNNDSDPMDDQGHGTHVAATAAGVGFLSRPDYQHQALLGVAPGATLYAFKVLGSNGSGYVGNVIGGIQACADPNSDGNPDDHLDVCNMSIGGQGNPDDLQSQAVDAATDAGTVFAIAAGNSGPNNETINSPGTARKAVTVAAACKPSDIGPNGSCSQAIAPFSSRGPVRWTNAQGVQQVIDKPDISAPGVKICAARFQNYQPYFDCFDGNHISISGTSMATPHVAGALALLKQSHPDFTPEQLKTALMDSAQSLGLPNNVQGAGMVNLAVAVTTSQQVTLANGPVIFKVTPTVDNTTFTKQIQLVNGGSEDIVYTIDPQLPNGVGLRNKNLVINVPAQGTTDLALEFGIDTSSIASGTRLNGQLNFIDQVTQNSLTVPVEAQVAHRLFLDPADVLDYGLDIASQPTWTGTKTLNLNTSNTESQTYTVTVQCCSTDGSTYPFNINAPATVKLQSGQPTPLPIALDRNNITVPNGRYSGKVTLKSTALSSSGQPLEQLSIPITFYKGFQLNLHYPTYKPDKTIMHSIEPSEDGFSFYFNPKEISGLDVTLYIPREAVFDIQNNYYPPPGGDNVYRYVFNENIDPRTQVVTVNIRSTDALNQIQLVTDPPSGESFGLYGETQYVFIDKRNGFPTSVVGLGAGFYSLPRIRNILISNLSDNYDFVETSVYNVVDGTHQPVAVSHSFHNGVSAGQNITLTINSGDYIDTPIYLGATEDSVVPSLCQLYYNPASALGYRYKGWFCVGDFGLQFSNNNGMGALRTATTDPRRLDEFEAPYYAFLNLYRYTPLSNTRPRYNSPSLAFDQQGIHALSFAQLGMDDLSKWYEQHKVELPTIPGITGGLLYDNTTWNSFIGAGRIVELGRDFGRLGQVPYRFSDGSDEFVYYLSRAFNLPLDIMVSAELTRDGEVVYQSSNTALQDGLYLPDSTPGNYQWKLTRNVVIGGLSTILKTESSFTIPTILTGTLPRVDLNPPSLKGLQLTRLHSNLMQNTLMTNQENYFEFKLSPTPGNFDRLPGTNSSFYSKLPDSFRNVIFEWSTDGAKWESLPLNAIAKDRFQTIFYPESVVPYSFRISASDLAGNTFKYTFAVPTIQGSPTDRQKPLDSKDPKLDVSPEAQPKDVSRGLESDENNIAR